MKIAAVDAIAALAREEVSEVAAKAYGSETPVFGPEYLIPSPFDPRLILKIAPAVARAAEATGVALRPIADWDAYLDRLNRFVYRSGLVMKPIFAIARNSEKRVIFSDGEDERVLRAAQVLLEDKVCRPILIGRPSVIETRLQRFGLRIRPAQDFEVVNPEDDPRYRDYVDHYFSKVRPPWREPGYGARSRAHEHDRDRRGVRVARGRRHPDLRPRRTLLAPDPRHPPDHRRGAGCRPLIGPQPT